MSNFKNILYIFPPFVYQRPGDLRPLVQALDGSAAWEQTHDEILYMYKYVADKINSYDKENCQCFHYELTPFGRQKAGLAMKKNWFSTMPYSFRGQKKASFFRSLKCICIASAPQQVLSPLNSILKRMILFG